MERLEKILGKYWVLAILLFSIPVIRALLVPGFYGASDDLHIAWLFEMDKVLKLRQIPPRYVPDLSFGFGYPLFNFVFPLPFYIGEIFHLLGLSFVDSIKAVFLISIPLSAIFMYLMLKEYTNHFLSFLGAILYIYTPYRAVDIYIRGAIGEIVSFIFLPLIILSVVKINKSKNLRWVGIGAIALASLVLSHNITAYMFFPFLGAFLVLQFFLSKIKLAFFAKSVLMIFLSLLISLYFWLPALLESGLVKYDTVFNFADHFPTFIQLIKPYWGYGASVAGPYDGMSFFLGFANLLILISGSILFFVKFKKINNEKKFMLIWVLGGILTAIFLMNHRSAFIWNYLPLLAFFQFPWRFLILTTFFTPLFLTVFENLKYEKVVCIILLVLIIYPGLTYFRPQDFLGRSDSYYLNRYIPTPFASTEYLKIQEEYLRLPKGTKVRPDKNYPVSYAEEGLIERVSKINDLHYLIEVSSPNGMNLNFTKYYFPGWVAKMDGQNTDIFAGKPFGQITILVPKGFHRIEIMFEETTFKKVLDAISLAAFLVSLLLAKLWIQSKKTGPSF